MKNSKLLQFSFVLLVGLLISTAGTAQRKINGIVLDSTTSLPLRGATVTLENSKTHTIADSKGKFELEIPGGKAALVVSFVGYNTQNLAVGASETDIVVKLIQSSNNQLSDIVIVGFGTQKKSDLTGAVSQVNMSDILQSRPVDNIGTALMGAIPGLNITNSSGQPGTSPSIDIRGFTSLNGGGPLILVDGIAVDNLNTVNPNDIKSVSVLKDAGASAIYGARAAYGVVLITTKKGSKNQPLRFEYSTNLASTQLYNFPEKSSPLEFVNALLTIGQTGYWAGQDLATWKTLITEYNQDPSKFPGGLTQVNGTNYSLKNINQYKAVFPGGFEQQHNFVVSGGSEKMFFRTAVGYNDENGPYASNNDSYKKWNFNTSFTAQIAKTLSVQTDVFYNNSNRLTPDIDTYVLATFPSFAQQGVYTDPTTGEKIWYHTPANEAEHEPPSLAQSSETRLSTNLVFTPINKLSITGQVSYDQPNYFNISSAEAGNTYINPLNFASATFNNSRYSKNNFYQTHTTINLFAKYAINTHSGHNLDFLAGANREVFYQSSFSINRTNLITSAVPSITTATGPIGGGDGYTAWAVQSLFGRIDYNYKGRYLLQINGRYDGSSRFAQGNQYGFFPSASAGWNITQESFMKPLLGVLNLLKVRASLGSVGNQNVNNYGYLPILSANNAGWLSPATGTPYVSINPPGLISSNYTWETVRTADIGVDIGLFGNKLTGSFDYYVRKTLHMLVSGGPAPATLGTGFPNENAANLKTTGTEIELQWQDRVGQLRYSVRFNMSNNNAYITKYDNNPAGLLGDYYVGDKLGSIWGYTTQGFFNQNDFEKNNINPDTQLPYPGTTSQLRPGIVPFKGEAPNPGDIRYVDKNNDGIINNGVNTLADHGDRSIIGNTNLQYIFGLNGSVSYKNFDFSFLLRGVGKAQQWIANPVTIPFQNQYLDIYKPGLNFWTPTHQDAYFARIYPEASGNTGRYSYQVQTKYLSNTAFLRVQSLALGYIVPTKLVKKIALDNVRVFFSGENLFTFDHLPKGIDPEAANLGTGIQYSFLRKYSFGIDVNF